MSDKIFDKDITYRAKVRVKAGTDEIIVRPEAQGKPGGTWRKSDVHHDRQAEPQACDPVDGPREEW